MKWKITIIDIDNDVDLSDLEEGEAEDLDIAEFVPPKDPISLEEAFKFADKALSNHEDFGDWSMKLGKDLMPRYYFKSDNQFEVTITKV
jgi:hypothetical protein